MQLHTPHVQQKIAELDARIVVVSFAPLEELRGWVPFFQKYFVEPSYNEQHLERPTDFFPRTRFVSDPTLAVYHTYGMGRNSVWRVYGWRIVRAYFQMISRGRPILKPRADTLQRGGDFVINREGRLTLAHVGRDQVDRPTIEDVITALGKQG